MNESEYYANKYSLEEGLLKIQHQEMLLPSVLYRPTLTIDGNMWCALYGGNLQTGVFGFGKSPYLALCDFNNNWFKELKG